ncbi:MAG TPA: U32 family peptidase C-terminal domain-containing protein [Candidatus Wallbacteria bacterium]|nr:U32 family peptidase C-terminal domain-containing protein [Candidatus Wallbacteria bacterium]
MSQNEFIKPELVVGAGDLERLKIAAKFGADAIYCGTNDFSLRAKCKNFSREELAFASEFLHSRGKKLFVTVNSIIHEDKIGELKEYLLFLDSIKADAVIFSDMAVLMTAKEIGLKAKLHLSTQASSANSLSLKFYRGQGVSRVNLARECSLEEIQKFPKVDGLTLEAFIHGAMCMSYSGRCLLSNFLTERGANDGACAQACRWKYYLVEEKRPGEYMPIVQQCDKTLPEGCESKGETYIFNSRDLMAVDLLPQLYEAGVRGFKIEGRIKGPHYVALVTLAHRKAFDAFERAAAEKKEFVVADEVYSMLNSVSNRGYIKGFYLGGIKSKDHNYIDSKYTKTYRMTGIISERTGSREYRVAVKNNIFAGRKYEFVSPAGIFELEIASMKDPDGGNMTKATNQKEAFITIAGAENISFSEYDLIRERNSD